MDKQIIIDEWRWKDGKEERYKIVERINKKHSDTSMSVTFDLVVWPWSFIKVKKADIIRRHLLYCILVPDIMSIGLILYEISPFVYLMGSLTFTCDLQLLSRSLALWSLDVFYVVKMSIKKIIIKKPKLVGSIEFEIWTFLWRKLKWGHPFDFLIFMKFKYISAEGISKRHTKFQFDQT